MIAGHFRLYHVLLLLLSTYGCKLVGFKDWQVFYGRGFNSEKGVELKCWKSDDFREGRREGRGNRVFLGVVASLSRELVTFGSVLDEGWMVLVCFG